jgi:small subunit ribosomal protein S1
MQSEPHPEPKPQPDPAAVDAAVDMETLLGRQEDYVARRGDIREGRVIELSAEGALIDIGLKREGFVPAEDLGRVRRAQMAEVAVGGDVLVMIVGGEDAEGYVELSIFQALLEKDWVEAERLQKSGEVYEAEVSGYNRGGLTVRFGRIRGFVPLSHVVGLPRGLSEQERRERLAAMVNQPIGLRVIEVDRQRRRLILSQRQAYRSWQRVRKRRLLEDLEEGQRRQGTVTSITDFGAFVDLGGIDGLVHISELSWQHVDHPSEAVSVGDEVEVEVVEVDRSRERIGLSIKRTAGDPWEQVADHYDVDQLVEGRVTRVTDIGAFVELEPGVEGLLHTSELVGAPNVTPAEVLQAEDEVLLKILRIEPGRRRIGLSARRVRRNEWEQWAASKGAEVAEELSEEVAEDSALVAGPQEPLDTEPESAEESVAEQEAVEEPVSAAEAEELPVEDAVASAETTGAEETAEASTSALDTEDSAEEE